MFSRHIKVEPVEVEDDSNGNPGPQTTQIK